MQTFFIVIYVLVGIMFARLLFRRLLNLPSYSGKTLADNSDIINTMPEQTFWAIIENAKRQSHGSYVRQCELLTTTLSDLTDLEIVQFDRTFSTLMAKSYSFQLWEAAYALNGGCSDDGFEFFRSWLIGQCRNKFYWTLRYPRLLLLVGVKELIEKYEGIAYCAGQAFLKKTGREIPLAEDIKYSNGGRMFRETEAFLRYPELALLAW